MVHSRIARPAGLLCLACLLAVPSFAGAATRVVAPGESIAAALDASAAGDTVLVACGTYQEQGLLLPDGVVLRGASDATDCVTIETAGGEPLLTCAPPGLSSRVERITFASLPAAWSSPSLRGGGVLGEGVSTVFAACRFVGLPAGFGAAAALSGGAPVFTDCEFHQNHAYVKGGALNCVDGAAPRLERCLLVGNYGAVGGSAINAAHDATPELVSCTLVGHPEYILGGWNGGALDVSATIIEGGGWSFRGDAGSAPRFRCSDISGNLADWTGLLADQEGRDGNFSADPHFCPPGTGAEDYALDVSSPCAPAHNPCGLVGAREVGCDGTVGVTDPPDGGPGDPPPPAATRLHHGFPNPFNPVTTVRFDLRRAGRVQLRVYDVAGRLVRRLLDETRPAGTHDVVWRGTDDAGRTVAAGVYFIRLENDGLIDTRRVALVK